MLADRPLRIEVLVNSPGPHDQVRIREPFGALQQLGADCRIHERPFRFSHCIRPHSLVIWQRPLPESRQRQWEHLQWLRERGCLLFTEWDDHPELFPSSIRHQLEATEMAPLQLCHMLHTSNPKLLEALRPWQPLGLAMENTIHTIPAPNPDKHHNGNIRVFVGNQNRGEEHSKLRPHLQAWLQQDARIQIVIIGDRNLASKLPNERIEYHPILNYAPYRRLLSSCQIALLPLEQTIANSCKTPIKWLECVAESVAVIAGPELYKQACPDGCSVWAPTIEQIVPLATALANEPSRRIALTTNAYHWLKANGILTDHTSFRLWIYQQLWRKRQRIDALTVRRLATLRDLPDMQEDTFAV
jgi:hypothetical protein